MSLSSNIPTRACLALACAIVIDLSTVSTHAQTPSADASSRAEEAYGRIDFEATLAASTEAIAGGGLDASACARLYFLMGVARAALGQENESRDAFLRMLALDPERTVERALSPRLRAPYLEARGLLDARAERLTLTVDRVASTDTLVVRARDPVSFVANVRVAVRRRGNGAWTQQIKPFAREMSVAMPPGAGVTEVAVALLDEHGNVLLTAGTTAEPRAFGEPVGSSAQDARTTPRAGGNGHIVAAGIAVAVGVLGLGAGVAGIFVRADGANSFNDDTLCFQPSTPPLTRGEQCAGDLNAARNGEIIAGIGFGVAGAAVIVALVVLAVGGGGDDDDRSTAALSCGSGPGTFGVACGVRF